MKGVSADKFSGGRCFIGNLIVASILWSPSLVCIPKTFNLNGVFQKVWWKNAWLPMKKNCTCTFKNICHDILLMKTTTLSIKFFGISIYFANFELISVVSVWGLRRLFTLSVWGRGGVDYSFSPAIVSFCLYILENLNILSIQQLKLCKYMYAKCLNLFYGNIGLHIQLQHTKVSCKVQ